MILTRLAALMAAGILLAIPLTTPSAFSEDKAAIATIEQPTCGLNVGAESLDFGTLMVGTIAPSDAVAGLPVTLGNTGNTITSSIALSGTDWENADPDIIAVILPATATHWSIVGGDSYASMNKVNEVTAIPGTIAAGGEISVYFRLKADLAFGQEDFSGGVTQTLTFVADC